jgi:carboxynorspermidine decarboxylase
VGGESLLSFDPSQVDSTPAYVCEEEKLKANLDIIERVKEEAGCKIILALKGFAMFSLFPAIRPVIDTASASSLNEARLGYEGFGNGVHLYAPAYRDEEFDDLQGYSSYISFNSFAQWRRFRPKVRDRIRCGIRVNPEHSEVFTGIYNPCGPNSRLGVTLGEFREDELEGISGLHFHNLCENNSDALERTLIEFEKKFGHLLGRMEWVNFGGGHHITREDYDVELLIKLVAGFREKYGVEVILEPGEAIALNAGVLVTSVLDIVNNGMEIAVLDTSASAHMPDVLEMPYRPNVIGAGSVDGTGSADGAFPHLYRLTGSTCLAGDVIGDYTFPKPLKIGDRLVFSDMLHYTMVKNTTFNGVALPSIGIWSEKNGYTVVRRPTYEDYRDRLS